MVSKPGRALTCGKLMGMQMLTLSQTSCYYFPFKKQLLGAVLKIFRKTKEHNSWWSSALLKLQLFSLQLYPSMTSTRKKQTLSTFFTNYPNYILVCSISETTIEGRPPIAVVPTHILYFCMSLSLYYTMRKFKVCICMCVCLGITVNQINLIRFDSKWVVRFQM